jgi:hypothetical protein
MGPHAIRNNLHTIPSRIEGSQRGDMVMLNFPLAANSAPLDRPEEALVLLKP